MTTSCYVIAPSNKPHWSIPCPASPSLVVTIGSYSSPASRKWAAFLLSSYECRSFLYFECISCFPLTCSFSLAFCAPPSLFLQFLTFAFTFALSSLYFPSSKYTSHLSFCLDFWLFLILMVDQLLLSGLLAQIIFSVRFASFSFL